jgi:hypothetical protein
LRFSFIRVPGSFALTLPIHPTNPSLTRSSASSAPSGGSSCCAPSSSTCTASSPSWRTGCTTRSPNPCPTWASKSCR